MKSASSPVSRRRPLFPGPTRLLSRLHRWLGTGFCLLFAMWFGTGFVMMYVPFPSLGEEARIAGSSAVNLSTVTVAPAMAVRGVPAHQLRLVDVLGRPRYLATLEDGQVVAIGADDGRPSPTLDAAAARRIAEGFVGRPAASVEGPFDYDQWVVHQRFDGARPFYRVALGDAAGTEVYVSARLGTVLQRTTRFERGWNWVGAVVHWIYPTILRKSPWAWDQVVWWLALGGIVVAAAGHAVGCVRTLNTHGARRDTGRARLSPFRGWLRWHHLLGLVGGAFALSWVFSGWLSMDHGRLFSLDQPDAARTARFRGAPLATALAGLTPERLRTLDSAREFEFVVVGGSGFVVLHGAPDARHRLVPLAHGVPQPSIEAIPDALLVRAAAAAWAPARIEGIGGIRADDAYGLTRSDPLPGGTRRIRIADEAGTWVHVDARAGRIVSQMDASRRAYRWLYTGLHRFDFPWLNALGGLRHALMLGALATGFALSVSALVLGKRRIARSGFVARIRRRSSCSRARNERKSGLVE